MVTKTIQNKKIVGRYVVQYQTSVYLFYPKVPFSLVLILLIRKIFCIAFCVYLKNMKNVKSLQICNKITPILYPQRLTDQTSNITTFPT